MKTFFSLLKSISNVLNTLDCNDYAPCFEPIRVGEWRREAWERGDGNITRKAHCWTNGWRGKHGQSGDTKWGKKENGKEIERERERWREMKWQKKERSCFWRSHSDHFILVLLLLSLSRLYFSSFLSIAQCDTLYSLRECVSSVKDLIKRQIPIQFIQ